MAMETLLRSNNVELEAFWCSLVEQLVVAITSHAQKSLLCPLFLIGSQSDGRNEFTSLAPADHRFPLAELTTVQEPDAETKDAGETEETDESEGEDNGEEGEEDESEEESDEEEDSDDDAEANGNSGSDEDDEDDGEDSDDDNEDDEDDDEEDDDEEQTGPPSKKKK